MMDTTTFPHGECECRDGCSCGGVRIGPAAFEVERDGRTLKVCTRCRLSSDTELRLLATGDDDEKVYFEYDALGFMIICGRLTEQREATQ